MLATAVCAGSRSPGRGEPSFGPTTGFRIASPYRRSSRSTPGSASAWSRRWARWRGCSARRARASISSRRGDAAKACLDSYFRELADRFEGGYDAAHDRSAPPSEMTPPAGRFVVARLDGDPVGCGAFKRVGERAGEIKRVWVAQPARGLGIARRMLQKLEEAAREMGLLILRLDTNKALTEAHALYRKEGYLEVEPFNDNPYAHHWFEKRL